MPTTAQAPIEILLITVKQAAQALQVSEKHVYNLMMDGRLKSLTIGASRRFELDEIKRFIRERAEDTFKMEFGALQLKLEAEAANI
jgi:excisionase family DNA binding protein